MVMRRSERLRGPQSARLRAALYYARQRRLGRLGTSTALVDLLFDGVPDSILSAGSASSPFNVDSVSIERTVAEGEFLATVIASNSANITTIGDPAGWTRNLENPASNLTNFLWSRLAPASLPTQIPFPLLSAGGVSYASVQIAVPEGDSIDVIGSTTEITSATCTAAGITTTVANTRLFAVFSIRGNQTVVTPPDGWELVESSTNVSFSVIGTHVFTKMQPVAGLTDAAVAVFSGSASNSGYQFAVSPK